MRNVLKPMKKNNFFIIAIFLRNCRFCAENSQKINHNITISDQKWQNFILSQKMLNVLKPMKKKQFKLLEIEQNITINDQKCPLFMVHKWRIKTMGSNTNFFFPLFFYRNLFSFSQNVLSKTSRDQNRRIVSNYGDIVVNFWPCPN